MFPFVIMYTLTDDILSRVGGLHMNDLNQLASNNDDAAESTNLISLSPYYEIHDINIAINSNEHRFCLLSINIQSIRSKFDEFTALLEFLQEKDVNFNAISIQETGLPDDYETNIFNIPGFKLTSKGKSASEKGGLIIYIKDSYDFTIRNKYNSSSLWEGLIIDIFHESLPSKITIGNIYRPPKFNNNNATLTNFLNEINPVLTTLSMQKHTHNNIR